MDLLTPSLGLIFWQLVAFLALLFILGKFAWRPILDALKARENSIAEALAAAENAKKEMANLKAENEQLLNDARKERDKILKEASEIANKIKDEARTSANKEGDKIIADARAMINTEKQAMLSDVKQQVADLSIQIAEKILREKLSDDVTQQKYVEDLLKNVNPN